MKQSGITWWVSGDMQEKSGFQGMSSGVLVVCMGQNSKPVDKIILPAVEANNQYLTHPKRGYNNHKFYINNAGIGLECDQVCDKVMPSIIPMTVCNITILFEKMSLDWSLKKCFYKVHRDQYIFHMTSCVDFCGDYLRFFSGITSHYHARTQQFKPLKIFFPTESS